MDIKIGKMDLKIQQVRFSKEFFENYESCVIWMEKEGIEYVEYSEFDSAYVFEYLNKDRFIKTSLQTFKLSSGVDAITGIINESLTEDLGPSIDGGKMPIKEYSFEDFLSDNETIGKIEDFSDLECKYSDFEDLENDLKEITKVKKELNETNDVNKSLIEAINKITEIAKSVKTIEIIEGEEVFVPIIKTLEERIVFGEVLVPDEFDGQDHTYSADEVKKACHFWMKKFQVMGEMHTKELDDEIQILESYLAPVSFKIEDTKVKKGTWLLKSYIASDELWEKVKNGEYNGYSIGGVATVEDLD